MSTTIARAAGRTVSVWMDTAPAVPGSKLTSDLRADVCIVGGGIAGMATAYLLAKEGKKVVVLDDGPAGRGQTDRTTAHLVFYNDDGLTVIEKLHGTEGLKLATESHSAAVDRIEQNVKAEKIDCDFHRVDGYLFVSPEGQGPDFLEQELDAAHRIGLTDANCVDRAPIPASTPAAACATRGRGSSTRSSIWPGCHAALLRARRPDLPRGPRGQGRRAARRRASNQRPGRS